MSGCMLQDCSNNIAKGTFSQKHCAKALRGSTTVQHSHDNRFNQTATSLGEHELACCHFDFQVLPQNLAIPFVEISRVLGLPPILVHADFVLVNWKKRNPCG